MRQACGLRQLDEHMKTIAPRRVQVEENGIRDKRVCRCGLTEDPERVQAVVELSQPVRDVVFLQSISTRSMSPGLSSISTIWAGFMVLRPEQVM